MCTGRSFTTTKPSLNAATFINTLTPDLYVEYFRDLGRFPVEANGLLSPADIGRTMARYDTEVVLPTS